MLVQVKQQKPGPQGQGLDLGGWRRTMVESSAFGCSHTRRQVWGWGFGHVPRLKCFVRLFHFVFDSVITVTLLLFLLFYTIHNTIPFTPSSLWWIPPSIVCHVYHAHFSNRSSLDTLHMNVNWQHIWTSPGDFYKSPTIWRPQRLLCPRSSNH